MRTRIDPEEIERIIARPYTIELEYGESPEDGVAAFVAEWPGCLTAGATREEALARIHDAMHDWVEASLERGLPVPAPMREYGGTVVVRIPKSLHRDVAKRAEHEGVSINQWIATSIARAIGAPAAAPRKTTTTARRARASAVAAKSRRSRASA